MITKNKYIIMASASSWVGGKLYASNLKDARKMLWERFGDAILSDNALTASAYLIRCSDIKCIDGYDWDHAMQLSHHRLNYLGGTYGKASQDALDNETDCYRYAMIAKMTYDELYDAASTFDIFDAHHEDDNPSEYDVYKVTANAVIYGVQYTVDMECNGGNVRPDDLENTPWYITHIA